MTTNQPRLIIVSGPPGAGKTRLARPLAKKLGMPLFSKDAIKEQLADSLGDHAASISGPLGLAATLQVFAIAGEMLGAGQSVIIEGFFHKGLAEVDIAPLLALADTTLVHVQADEALLLSRYEQRATSPDRHPIHNGGHRLGDLKHYLAEGVADPLDLDCHLVIIDTTYGSIDVEEVAFMIQDRDD